MEQRIAQIALRDGNVVPQLGYGTWQLSPGEAQSAIEQALAAGFRSFDTARDFGTEEALGAALRNSGLVREAVTIASRLPPDAVSREAVQRSFDASMTALGLQQIDLFELSWPTVAGDNSFVEAWTVLVELQQQGHIRSIGVSNFEREHLERIIAATGVAPAINQVELHPLFQQRDFRGYYSRHNIRISSWSPLGPGTPSSAYWWQEGRRTDRSALDHPLIVALADKHGRTPAQIILRWHLQDGLLPYTRSTRPERMAEALAVGSFALDAEDMYRIEALDLSEEGRMGRNTSAAQPA